MVAIGAYFTGPEAHALAEEIHKYNLQSVLSVGSPENTVRKSIADHTLPNSLLVFGMASVLYNR